MLTSYWCKGRTAYERFTWMYWRGYYDVSGKAIARNQQVVSNILAIMQEEKFFRNGSSKIYGRQLFKNLKWHVPFKRTILLEMFNKGCSCCSSIVMIVYELIFVGWRYNGLLQNSVTSSLLKVKTGGVLILSGGIKRHQWKKWLTLPNLMFCFSGQFPVILIFKMHLIIMFSHTLLRTNFTSR